MTDKYTPEMAHAAVEFGAAWLDEHCPDWVTHIDLHKLRLDSQSACVLGQAAECLTHYPVRYCHYNRVLAHFGKSVSWAETHGFDVPTHQFVPGVCNEATCTDEIWARYEMLTISWREYIRQRVETPA